MLKVIKNCKLNSGKLIKFLNLNAGSKYNVSQDKHINNEEDLILNNLIIMKKKKIQKKL